MADLDLFIGRLNIEIKVDRCPLNLYFWFYHNLFSLAQYAQNMQIRHILPNFRH